MDIATDALSVIATAASGGLFGLIGAILGAGLNLWRERQQMIARREERAHELELQKLQIQRGQAETESELRIIEAKAAGEMKVASYDFARAGGTTSRWVNNVLSLFRPLLTLVALALTAWIYDRTISGDPLPYVPTPELVQYIVCTVVFCASSAFTWWFGERAFMPEALKRRIG